MPSMGYGETNQLKVVAGQTIADDVLGLIAVLTASLTATICTTPNGAIADAPAGVFNYPCASGHMTSIATDGLVLITTAQSMASGIFVTCNASARAVPCASGSVAIARLMEASTAGDEKRQAMLVTPFRFIGT